MKRHWIRHAFLAVAQLRTQRAQNGLPSVSFAHMPPWKNAKAISVAAVQRDLVAEEAIAVLSAKRSAWSEAELTAATEAAAKTASVARKSRREKALARVAWRDGRFMAAAPRRPRRRR